MQLEAMNRQEIIGRSITNHQKQGQMMTTAYFLNEEMKSFKSNDGFIIKVYINYESNIICSIKSWKHDEIHEFVKSWVGNSGR